MSTDVDEVARSAASQINALFEERRADGSALYSTDELEHFLPAVALMLLAPGEVPSPELTLALGKVVLAAGGDPSLPADQVFAALIAHYRQRPPHSGLVNAVNRILRETLGGATTPESARAAAHAVLGTVQARLSRSGERPAGAIPAGPMARFRVRPPPRSDGG